MTMQTLAAASVATGDTTPIKLYIILGIVAAVLIAASVVLKVIGKKKK